MEIFAHYGDLQASMNSSMRGRRDYQKIGSVAVVEIVGALSRGESWWRAGSSYDAIIAAMQQIEADPDIGSAVLLVNSPGGSAAGVDDAAQAIHHTSRRKPVTAFIEDLGASAAYYLASQAAKIYANRSALVGSIGTYTVVDDMSAMAAKIGVRAHVVRAGKFKGMGTPGTEITAEQLAEIQRIVDSANEFFVEAVASGRRIQLPFVREHIADGRVHPAADAHRLHLIDGISTFNDVFASHRNIRSPRESQAAAQQAAAVIASSPSPSTTKRPAMSAKSEFDELVSSGMSREKAHQKVCREHPELREEMVREHNEDHRRRRMQRR